MTQQKHTFLHIARFSCLALAATLATACGGDTTPGTLVSVTDVAPGADCAYGGQQIEVGVDDNGDGVLDPGEVDSTTFVCNGAEGTDGANSLVAVTDESAGDNCASGGQKVETGVDDNGNGVLDSDEVENTFYVCNGATSLITTTDEPAGPNCAAGGQKITTGVDDNGNGVLDASEAQSTVYVCTGEAGDAGTDGHDTLVSATLEPADGHCTFGGQKLDIGVDDSGDGVLDANEIDRTAYVCNGADGVPQSCRGWRIGATIFLSCDDGTEVTWEVGFASSNALFVDSGQSLDASSSSFVSLGDLDGDGDLDAFVVNLSGEGNRVWLNDGTGHFTNGGQSLGSSDSASVSLGDLDGDGDLDAFVANFSGGGNRVWLNDGTGHFSDSGQSLGSSDSACVSLGDLDGDGDLDAFIANFKQDNTVWLNH